ncbi:MAG: TlpA family protein disulfide reductase [Candidatus Thiodiazotropha lotti]|uniref:TlpA family protein disulfide reductase n=1 Tax=Candidatus Thiodiazotropha endoloripes TaxID=1818881 RepID=UPI00083E540E|nr:TlpA disulfide reductase family protein [Candidatus Thiodiazotropha endoloripes]MCG7897888.1 TlpA family protein disulfide reductase [Candidatus Thiodiazotropha weberae]MCG7990354.1 TlpA family protein disulfide reductase [Candidatus Thiodiazotropha lotti]MCG7902636.1 TlpA family protein disulfide reductase [Candidatus Thiodiazotropha weberae]MCG7913452.1 TlpA family protein disulfide reductase [Candidatus Thiodiazotropha weberae]MCG7999009.1 TlpA family protein disulfide reductase [Candida
MIFGFLLLLFCHMGNAGWLEAVNPPTLTAKIELNDLNKVQHNLSEAKGKVVLINFWASWCPPCIEEMPSLIRLVEHMKTDDLQVLAVNVNENRNRVARIASKLGFNFPVLLDATKSVTKDWRITVYPSSFLIDKQGFLRFKAIGPVEWDSEESIAQVKQLLSEAYP